MAHLIQCIGIQQYPAQLNDLSRVLGHVDAVLVTGSGDVDDNVSVDLEGRALLCGHVCGLGGSVGALEPVLSRIEMDATPLSEDACLAMGVKKRLESVKKEHHQRKRQGADGKARTFCRPVGGRKANSGFSGKCSSKVGRGPRVYRVHSARQPSKGIAELSTGPES